MADNVEKFMALFDGLDTAFGTGAGRWVKRPPRREDFERHLAGVGPGIGIGPLRPDNTVMFAAIDLDEPDFAAAFEMQEYIPGQSWVERSRSGNAHIWVFFAEPIEAWVPMGILKEATLAAGKPHVEVFPKNHDFSRVLFGNYLNLPYHGDSRPVVENLYDVQTDDGQKHPIMGELPLYQWLHRALETRNHPADWHRKAQWLMVTPPGERSDRSEFGEQANLHSCAERILSGEAGLIPHGHQNAVLFMLSKCLTNWRQVDHDEALMVLRGAVRELFHPVPSDREVRRILTNVERARYTSTGCDDPLVLPFSDPECGIAHPRR